MVNKVLEEADKLIHELVEQYSKQFQKEYDSIKASIQNMIDEVLAKFEQKIVANEKEARESFETEMLKKLEIMKTHLQQIEKENRDFKTYIAIDLKRQERELNERIDNLLEEVTLKIAAYIKENPKEIRKSFFNFRKKLLD
jgi:hypothetical protein